MGCCVSNATVAPATAPPEKSWDNPTVPVGSSSGSCAPEAEASPDNDDGCWSETSSAAGSPCPTYTEELLSNLLGTKSIFAMGKHKLVVVPAWVENEEDDAIEEELEEKKFDLSRCPPLDSGQELAECLDALSMGMVCRKGRSEDYPNQDSFGMCQAGIFMIFAVADGYGESGHWASSFATQVILAFMLKEVCSSGALPDDYTLGRVFNVTHDALRIKSKELGLDIDMSGTTFSLCIVDTAAFEILVSWVGDSRCLLCGGGQDSVVTRGQETLQVLTANRNSVLEDEIPASFSGTASSDSSSVTNMLRLRQACEEHAGGPAEGKFNARTPHCSVHIRDSTNAPALLSPEQASEHITLSEGLGTWRRPTSDEEALDDIRQVPDGTSSGRLKKASTLAFSGSKRVSDEEPQQEPQSCEFKVKPKLRPKRAKSFSAGVSDRKSRLGKAETKFTGKKNKAQSAEKKEPNPPTGRLERKDSSADFRNELSGALGDLTRHNFGLDHKPSIKRLPFKPFNEADDAGADNGGQFLLCCSYGVWDMVHTFEAARLVRKFGRTRSREATEALVQEVVERWGDEEETEDITIVVLWL